MDFLGAVLKKIWGGFKVVWFGACTSQPKRYISEGVRWGVDNLSVVTENGLSPGISF